MWYQYRYGCLLVRRVDDCKRFCTRYRYRYPYGRLDVADGSQATTDSSASSCGTRRWRPAPPVGRPEENRRRGWASLGDDVPPLGGDTVSSNGRALPPRARAGGPPRRAAADTGAQASPKASLPLPPVRGGVERDRRGAHGRPGLQKLRGTAATANSFQQGMQGCIQRGRLRRRVGTAYRRGHLPGLHLSSSTKPSTLMHTLTHPYDVPLLPVPLSAPVACLFIKLELHLQLQHLGDLGVHRPHGDAAGSEDWRPQASH